MTYDPTSREQKPAAEGSVSDVKQTIDEASKDIVEKADDVVAGAGETAERVQRHPVYQGLVTGGLIAYGVMHLLLAGLVVQVVRGVGADASESGSIRMIASAPFGFVLLLLIVLGMAALALWQVLLALFGYGYLTGARLLRRKLSSLGRAGLYAGLGLLATRVLWGVEQNSNASTQSTSAALLNQWYGPPLLVIAGIVISLVAVAMIRRGVVRSFAKHDLQGSVPRWAVWLGSVGWVMKGVTQLVLGFLFWVAAWQHDPTDTGSLDLALKTIAGQPFGRATLVTVAAGFAAFGGYCFIWAFNARHDVSKD